jgi:hypothetical protein
MTSSGSGSQFLLRRGGGDDSDGEGRKRGVLDVRRGGMRECADEDRREAPSWLCHMAYVYAKGGVGADAPVLCPRGGGRRGRRSREKADSVAGRMYARRRGLVDGTHLYWTLVSIVIGTNTTHLDVPAHVLSRGCVFTRQRRVVTVIRGVDRRCMRSFLAWVGSRRSRRRSKRRRRNRRRSRRDWWKSNRYLRQGNRV